MTISLLASFRGKMRIFASGSTEILTIVYIMHNAHSNRLWNDEENSAVLTNILVSLHEGHRLTLILLNLICVVVVASLRGFFQTVLKPDENFLWGTDVFPDQSEGNISNNVVGLPDFSRQREAKVRSIEQSQQSKSRSTDRI